MVDIVDRILQNVVDKMVFEHVVEVSIDPFEEVDQILGQIRK